MILQRLVEAEARQRQADEALLKATASAQLLQVPIWSTSLQPGQSQATASQLQGTLTIPKDCSVRFMRRGFARTIQVTQQTWSTPYAVCIGTCGVEPIMHSTMPVAAQKV